MVQMQDVMSKPMPDFREGSIVKGRILEVRPREVLVDIGYKSEGVISLSEFEDVENLEVGDEVDVLLERLENDEGMVVLSKEKAAYRQNWNKIASVFQEDGLIKGKVKSVVKGGLMVNIGVEAFLPASQIDIVPPKDLQQFVGNTYDFKIVKINDDRRNVVLGLMRQNGFITDRDYALAIEARDDVIEELRRLRRELGRSQFHVLA